MLGVWKHIIQHVYVRANAELRSYIQKKNTQNTPTSKEKCASILVCHQVYGYTLDACCSHDIRMRNSHKATNPSFSGILPRHKTMTKKKLIIWPLGIVGCVRELVMSFCVLLFLQPRGSCCFFDRWKSNPYIRLILLQAGPIVWLQTVF